MHIALVTHGLPSPVSNGGPITCWAILQQALRCGHRVTVVTLQYPGDPFATPERHAVVKDTGATVITVPVNTEATGKGVVARLGMSARRISQALPTADPALFFPWRRTATALQAAVSASRADVAFVYHWDTLAALSGLRTIPLVAGVSDPWHLPRLRRWQRTRPDLTRDYVRETIQVGIDGVLMPRLMVSLLRQCRAAGCFQAQAAAWLRSRGATHCEYFPSPVVDPLEPHSPIMKRDDAPGKPKILIGPSNLGATSTAAGLEVFAREILPILDQQVPAEQYEVHIIGEGTPPQALARVLPHPSIIMRGRVEPPDEEFLSSAIQLVPTPFVLGVRVRILVGLAFGICLVAHRTEMANIPELAPNVNCLIGDDGRQLAEHLITALGDPALRRTLGAAARDTYEKHFHPSVAATKIMDRLESVVAGQ